MLAEARRCELLAAIGIDRYLRRAAAAPIGLVVVCERTELEGESARRLQRWLPAAIGLAAHQIRWLAADGARLPPLPPARALLVLGERLAPLAARSLRTELACAVADAPAASLRDAMTKRALWQALKPIARCLRTRTS
jgi:hypothetical protein